MSVRTQRELVQLIAQAALDGRTYARVGALRFNPKDAFRRARGTFPDVPWAAFYVFYREGFKQGMRDDETKFRRLAEERDREDRAERRAYFGRKPRQLELFATESACVSQDRAPKVRRR